MQIACVAGARPNFVKIKPVMDALEARSIDVWLIHAGQHYDVAMSDVFFEDLQIRTPDRFLDSGSGSHAEQTGRVMHGFEQVLRDLTPDVVVVVGDVNATLACALVTSKSSSRLAHVEAGLRSGDRSMPEEVNREVTDLLSDFLFASEPSGQQNLIAEGRDPDSVFLVGNVMVDSLLTNLERAQARRVPQRFGVEPGFYILATLHRPSNVDDAVRLRAFVELLAAVSELCPVLLPCHPRTAQALRALDIPPSLQLLEPLGYLDFVALEAGARLVLTDSGGVQEETTALGVRCLTLRDNTERPITVEEGTNEVVGSDPTKVLPAVERALNEDPPDVSRPLLWDGKAAERIADVLAGVER